MKRVSVFFIILLIIGFLTITASGVNNRGTYELVDEAAQSIERLAYDSDGPVWSDARTWAGAGLLGHGVSAGCNVYSNIDPHLYGSFAVSARLNHDWVDPARQSDDDYGEWARYLNKDAYTSDTDWGNHDHDESETIRDCGTDGFATARDTRTSSVLDGTSVRIPWSLDAEEEQGDAGGDTDTPNLGISPADSEQIPQPGDSATLTLVTEEAYDYVNWHVKAPWETSERGTYVECDWGDGTINEATFSYTFPSGAMHTGDFLITAVICRWSDLSEYEETYTVTVDMTPNCDDCTDESSTCPNAGAH